MFRFQNNTSMTHEMSMSTIRMPVDKTKMLEVNSLFNPTETVGGGDDDCYFGKILKQEHNKQESATEVPKKRPPTSKELLSMDTLYVNSPPPPLSPPPPPAALPTSLQQPLTMVSSHNSPISYESRHEKKRGNAIMVNPIEKETEQVTMTTLNPDVFPQHWIHRMQRVATKFAEHAFDKEGYLQTFAAKDLDDSTSAAHQFLLKYGLVVVETDLDHSRKEAAIHDIRNMVRMSSGLEDDPFSDCMATRRKREERLQMIRKRAKEQGHDARTAVFYPWRSHRGEIGGFCLPKEAPPPAWATSDVLPKDAKSFVRHWQAKECLLDPLAQAESIWRLRELAYAPFCHVYGRQDLVTLADSPTLVYNRKGDQPDPNRLYTGDIPVHWYGDVYDRTNGAQRNAYLGFLSLNHTSCLRICIGQHHVAHEMFQKAAQTLGNQVSGSNNKLLRAKKSGEWFINKEVYEHMNRHAISLPIRPGCLVIWNALCMHGLDYPSGALAKQGWNFGLLVHYRPQEQCAPPLLASHLHAYQHGYRVPHSSGSYAQCRISSPLRHTIPLHQLPAMNAYIQYQDKQRCPATASSLRAQITGATALNHHHQDQAIEPYPLYARTLDFHKNRQSKKTLTHAFLSAGNFGRQPRRQPSPSEHVKKALTPTTTTKTFQPKCGHKRQLEEEHHPNMPPASSSSHGGITISSTTKRPRHMPHASAPASASAPPPTASVAAVHHHQLAPILVNSLKHDPGQTEVVRALLKLHEHPNDSMSKRNEMIQKEGDMLKNVLMDTLEEYVSPAYRQFARLARFAANTPVIQPIAWEPWQQQQQETARSLLPSFHHATQLWELVVNPSLVGCLVPPLLLERPPSAPTAAVIQTKTPPSPSINPPDTNDIPIKIENADKGCIFCGPNVLGTHRIPRRVCPVCHKQTRQRKAATAGCPGCWNRQYNQRQLYASDEKTPLNPNYRGVYVCASCNDTYHCDAKARQS